MSLATSIKEDTKSSVKPSASIAAEDKPREDEKPAETTQPEPKAAE